LIELPMRISSHGKRQRAPRCRNCDRRGHAYKIQVPGTQRRWDRAIPPCCPLHHRFGSPNRQV
jgi:hypothetical protein